MILDKLCNIENYLGISPDLDKALKALKVLNPDEVQPGDVLQVSEGTTLKVMASKFRPKEMKFEFHRRFIDVHCPLEGEEKIGVCDIGDCPADVAFNEEKDIGFFEGEAVNLVRVPAGWFCVTFPQDAHCPGISQEEQTVKKIVAKVLYSEKS